MSYQLRPPRRGKSEYYQAIITTPEGDTFERTTRTKLKSVAERLADRWDRETALPSHNVTLEQAFVFLEQALVDRRSSESTFEIFRLKVAHVLGFFGVDKLAQSIDQVGVMAYVRHRRGKGVSDSTISKEMGYLLQALHHLKWLRKYTGDPKDLWPRKVLKAGKKGKRWLKLPEYEKLLLAMAAPRGYFRKQRYGGGKHGGRKARRQYIEHDEPMGTEWRDFLVAYVYSGMRLSELPKVRGVHVDLKRGEIEIHGTKTEGARRTLPIHPELREVLEQRVKLHGRGLLFPTDSPNYKAYKRAWLRALRRACERAGIPHASSNDLRRTFASWCFQDGVIEQVCVRWMGHSSGRMVKEVYAQMSEEMSRAEMAKLRSPKRSGGDGKPPAAGKKPPIHIPFRQGDRRHSGAIGGTKS